MVLKALLVCMAIILKIFILTNILSFQWQTHLGFSIAGAIFSAALLGMSIFFSIYYDFNEVTTYFYTTFKCFRPLDSFSFCF